MKTKDHSLLERHLEQHFPNQWELYKIEGHEKKTNGGTIDPGLWSILQHSGVDDTALDITKNHVAMIQKAHDNGWEHVLFLEDDARMGSISELTLNHVNEWLVKNEQKWDIFYLGYCQWPLLISFLVTPSIVKLTTPLGAHAYLLNRKGMQKILMYAQAHHQQHFDKLLCRVPSLTKYGIFPMIAFQETDPALHVKACDYLGCYVSFATLSRVSETVSLCIPILFILMVLFVVVRFINKKVM